MDVGRERYMGGAPRGLNDDPRVLEWLGCPAAYVGEDE